VVVLTDQIPQRLTLQQVLEAERPAWSCDGGTLTYDGIYLWRVAPDGSRWAVEPDDLDEDCWVHDALCRCEICRARRNTSAIG
jgi:hypothetical protein